MSITDALRLSLSGLSIDDRDQAIVELAYTVAKALDDLDDNGGDLDKLTHRMQALLHALLLTPQARAVTSRGDATGEPLASPIDELRARRKRRT